MIIDINEIYTVMIFLNFMNGVSLIILPELIS